MTKMKKYDLYGKLTNDTLKEIDSGVGDVISDLNANGITTLMSCHGHKGHQHMSSASRDKKTGELKYTVSTSRGWITFYPKEFNKQRVLSILQKHGLKRIVFGVIDANGKGYPYTEKIISVSFSMVR